MVVLKKKNISTKQLAGEAHKLIIGKFNKRKVHSPFIDSICGMNLADVQLICKFNKGFRLLLRAIDIYIKYAWVIPLKDKKEITIANAFQKVVDECSCKPNRIRVDKSS